MSDKFPLRIIRFKEKGLEFKATTSIDKITKTTGNIRQELNYLEHDYRLMVDTVCRIFALITKIKKADPRLYWLAGDTLIGFLSRIDEIGFYLVQQNSTLARDIGLSESSIERIIAFRKRFSKISLVNPSIPWVRYKSNKVPVPR